MTCAPLAARMSRNSKMPSAAASSSAPDVTSWAPRSPIARPKKPARTAPNSGRKRTATATRSALHHADVLDPDRAAVAKVDDEDGQPDRRLRSRHGQHEHGEGLPDHVIQQHREG